MMGVVLLGGVLLVGAALAVLFGKAAYFPVGSGIKMKRPAAIALACFLGLIGVMCVMAGLSGLSG
jgi:hypothetical protein